MSCLERLLDCPECHGTAHDEDGIECETCGGKGYIELNEDA